MINGHLLSLFLSLKQSIKQTLFGLAFRVEDNTTHEPVQRAVYNQTLHKQKTVGQSQALVAAEAETR